MKLGGRTPAAREAEATPPQGAEAAPTPFSLFDKEEEVLRGAAQMLQQLQDLGSGVGELADAYRQSYREQQRLVRLSDRMQRDLQKAKARLAEQARDLQALNETLAAEIQHRNRLELELRSMVETDVLTGARSRRRFLELAAKLTEAGPHGRSPVSVLMLDLDRFKLLNDTHGHEAGDGALRSFAQRVQGLIRGADVLGRLGGEEFGLLLPDTTLRQAEAIANRIVRAIAALAVPLPDGGSIPITVSIGAAEAAAGETPEAMLRRADLCLYEAKRLGRNRVVAQLPDAGGPEAA